MFCRKLLDSLRATICNAQSHTLLGSCLGIRNICSSNILISRSAVKISDETKRPSVQDALRIWTSRFQEKNISDPLESIANILAHALNTKKIADVYSKRDQKLTDEQIGHISEMCFKRMKSMPLQYIVGEWEFRELTLKLRPPVFIPRPETEMLVEIVLCEIAARDISTFLELCCGSGAISLALLNQKPDLRGLAIDSSKDACELCEENAKLLGLRDRLDIRNIKVEKLLEALKHIQPRSEGYDLIVSNPPYVPSEEMKTLQPEILDYEDHKALDGGWDGMDVIRQIFTVSSRILNPHGKLFLEVDPSHPRHVRNLLADPEQQHLGLRLIRSHPDLAGEERFIEIIKST